MCASSPFQYLYLHLQSRLHVALHCLAFMFTAHSCILTKTYTYTMCYIYIYICIFVYVFTYIYICIYIYVCTDKYTRTCISLAHSSIPRLRTALVATRRAPRWRPWHAQVTGRIAVSSLFSKIDRPARTALRKGPASGILITRIDRPKLPGLESTLLEDRALNQGLSILFSTRFQKDNSAGYAVDFTQHAEGSLPSRTLQCMEGPCDVGTPEGRILSHEDTGRTT